MTTDANVFQDVGCTTKVEKQRTPYGGSVQFYRLRRKPTQFFCSCFIFALLLLSNLQLRASSIPEIVTQTKPAVVEIVAMDEKGQPKTLGTGFFLSSDGLVVTNFHVIQGASSIAAINNNGAVFLFQKVVVQPPGVDLAILQFQASDVPYLKLGKSTTAVEGQKVIVIGNPTGLNGTVSDGIISAFRDKRSLIQITAPISPGSSGSPVMDEDGQVIGVATLQSVEGQNLNFAIAVEKVSAALSDQGISVPAVEPPNQSSGTIAQKSPTPIPFGVLMVTAKDVSSQTDAEFVESESFLSFYASGRAIAVSKESSEIGHGISFKNPGIGRSPSTGEWCLPYPLALAVQAFLHPGSIRPGFSPDRFYLLNASDGGSQEGEKTETLIRALLNADPKLFIVPEEIPLSSDRAAILFLKIITQQTDGPDGTVAITLFASPGPLDGKYSPMTADLKLASFLAEQILQGFELHREVVSSLSGTALVGKTPQPWDMPTLGIELRLTESGYTRLAKNGFNEVASSLAEGLQRFKTEMLVPALPTATPTPAVDAKVYFESGVASLGELNYDKAIIEFTEAIRLDPSYAHAYYNRGLAYEKKGNLDRAFSDYNEAIRLYPNFAPAYLNRGAAYEKKGNLDKAFSDYNEAVRLDSHSVLAFLNRGIAYEKKGNLDKAISDYSEAIRLDPDYAPAYGLRGVAYGNEGHADKAIIDFSECIRLGPNSAPNYYNRGVGYEKKGNLDKAISDYSEAIRLDLNYAPAYINRGKLYLHTGHRDKANADFATARRLKGNQ